MCELSGSGIEFPCLNIDLADISAEKAEGRWWSARQQGVCGRRDGVEANAIGKDDVISRTRMEGPLDIERRIATEEDPAGIEQKQIRSLDSRTQGAIDI